MSTSSHLYSVGDLHGDDQSYQTILKALGLLSDDGTLDNDPHHYPRVSLIQSKGLAVLGPLGGLFYIRVKYLIIPLSWGIVEGSCYQPTII